MPHDPAAAWNDTPTLSTRVHAVLARLSSVMRAEAWRQAAAEGLTPTQADLLALLGGRPPGARLGWLAEQLSITSATASDAVATLVAKGWVEKARATDDARALSLRLTRSGAALARRLAAPSGLVETATAVLPAQDQETLLYGLMTLVVQLQHSEGFPAMRTCVSCEHFQAHRHADARASHHCHLVGAPLPASLLRVDCPEHQPAVVVLQPARWRTPQV